MYSKWNPIHFIKGKKVIENQELVDKYTNSEEKLKRLLFTLSMYLIPGVYAYLYLIIFGEIKYRTLFYIPMIGLYILIKYYRIKYEAILIYKCRLREEESNGVIEWNIYYYFY